MVRKFDERYKINKSFKSKTQVYRELKMVRKFKERYKIK